MSEAWTRAVAYLKPNLTDGSEATVLLNHEDSPILRDLHNGLLVAYLVDKGTSFDYLQNRHLIAAGIDEDRLHKTAIDNLYSLAERHLRIQPYGPVFALFMEGNFEASVLLLDSVWDISLAKHVKGEFVAAVPARDVLAFGDSSLPEAVAELRAIYRPSRVERGRPPAIHVSLSSQARYLAARLSANRTLSDLSASHRSAKGMRPSSPGPCDAKRPGWLSLPAAPSPRSPRSSDAGHLR